MLDTICTAVAPDAVITVAQTVPASPWPRISAQIRSAKRENPQVSALSQPRSKKRGPTQVETDLWHTPAGDQPVQFWREPLSALCAAATGSGFLIEQLIEPVPAETMRDRYPEEYEQLSREPGFLILRLLKRAAPKPSPPG